MRKGPGSRSLKRVRSADCFPVSALDSFPEMELTVAEVSGLIAAGVFVLQVLIPLAIPWALIAFLSNEHSILTW